MKFNNLITPAILSCVLPFAFSANAWEPVADNATDYNFATVKAGIAQPTNLGGNSGLDTGNVTYSAGILAGRKMMDMFSIDVEYMHRGKDTASSYGTGPTPYNNSNSWSMQSDTFMLNASIDLIKDPKIRPYVRAGAGISRNKSYNYTSTTTFQSGRDENTNAPIYSTDVNTYSGKTTNKFAWQVGGGANFKTTDMLDTQLEYMYVNRGKVETQANYSSSYSGKTVTAPAIDGTMKEHVITVGLKVKF